MRLHGEMKKLKAEELTDAALRELLRELPAPEAWQQFEDTGDVDFGYELEGVARFRANYFMQKNGAAAVFRLIPSDILNCEQLGLPQSVRKLSQLKKGLVLVTGPTGSGKSPPWRRSSTTPTAPAATTSSPSRTPSSSCTPARAAW
jgi:twitching motility protein PilT